MINNFNTIEEYLKFTDEAEFYFIQILKRRKDNPDMPTHSKTIKEYYVGNMEYYRKKEEEIIKLCDSNNARATIILNKRNYDNLAKKMNIEIAKIIDSGQSHSIKSCFSSCCGKYSSEKTNKWILDLDNDDDNLDLALEIITYIEGLQPLGSKLYGLISSKSGRHIIVKPFDPRGFKDKFPTVEIKKDTPTNLYIP